MHLFCACCMHYWRWHVCPRNCQPRQLEKLHSLRKQMRDACTVRMVHVFSMPFVYMLFAYMHFWIWPGLTVFAKVPRPYHIKRTGIHNACRMRTECTHTMNTMHSSRMFVQGSADIFQLPCLCFAFKVPRPNPNMYYTYNLLSVAFPCFLLLACLSLPSLAFPCFALLPFALPCFPFFALLCLICPCLPLLSLAFACFH